MPVISDILINASGFRSVAVDFQNSKIQPNQQNDLKGVLYESDNGNIVGIMTDTMLYTGQVEDDELYHNFIMVHNKRNGKIRLLQIDNSTASPQLDKKNFSSSAVLLNSENSVSELNKQFGSKASKRLTEQRERLTMNIDAVKDQLEQTVSDIKISEGAMDQVVNENNSIYRPKINRDASTRDDVYNLEDLVPSDILNTLQTEAINVINSGDINHFGGFVASNIGTILRSDISQEMMIRKITIFLYIEYLIRFISTPMKSVTKKFCVCDKSVEVNNHILDTFSVNGPSGRNRPVHMKDKSLCYILILAAKAMDYEVDLTNLTKDCKIGVKKALEISRILAFNSSSKNKNVVTLKLPLPAPVAFKTKRRK